MNELDLQLLQKIGREIVGAIYFLAFIIFFKSFK